MRVLKLDTPLGNPVHSLVINRGMCKERFSVFSTMASYIRRELKAMDLFSLEIKD